MRPSRANSAPANKPATEPTPVLADTDTATEPTPAVSNTPPVDLHKLYKDIEKLDGKLKLLYEYSFNSNMNILK